MSPGEESRAEDLQEIIPEETAQWFGPFRILETIAHGGMGIVYKAIQPGLNRRVALKLLLSGAHASEEFIRRFQREAETAAQLRHPNIVIIHDVGQVEGQPYLAMELIEGPTLAHLLNQGPLSIEKAVRYLEVIARAIHHAHENQILHRDLKPSNVLIDEQDQPRITDFGLAKRMDSDAQITLTGQMMGSPHYLAPEQALGKDSALSPATDVYALGAMLYEMLAGRPPLMGHSIQETLIYIRDREPTPIRLLNPSLPRDLETICLKCLAKQPSHRYSSALELADDLQRFRQGQPILARPVSALERTWRWARKRPALSGALTIALLALLAVAVISTTMSIRLDRIRRALVAQAEANRQGLVRLHSETGDQLLANRHHFAALLSYNEALKLSPESNQNPLRIRIGSVLRNSPPLITMVFHESSVNTVRFDRTAQRMLTASSDRSARLWDVATGKALLQPLLHEGEVLDAVFSPNNEWIATASKDGKARTWSPQTGEPLINPLPHQAGRRLRPYPPYLVITPDSAELLLIDGAQVLLINPTNAQPRLVLNHPDIVEHANVSEDGTQIVTCARDNLVRLWDRYSGVQRDISIQVPAKPVAAWFSPDGHRISTSTGDAVARIWDAKTGEPLSPPIQHRGMPSQCLFSSNGNHMLTASFDLTRVWNGQDGQPVSSALTHNHLVYQARFSPDGTLVATASFDNQVKFWDTLTGNPRLTTLPHAAYATWVEFSPDGQLFATASRDGAVRLWQLPTPEVQVYPFEHQTEILELNPDQTLLATGNDHGFVRLFEVNTGQALGDDLAMPGAITSIHFNPQGTFLLISDETGLARLFQISPLSLLHEFRHETHITWSEFDASGQRALTSSEDGTARVWDVETGHPISPPLKHDLGLWHSSFSPDGSRVITGSRDGSAQIWDSTTGTPLGPRMLMPGNILMVRFSPDGTQVVTACHDMSTGPGSARIWDAQTGKPLTPPLPHQSGITDAVFSPDGSLLITGGADNTARIWDVKTAKLAVPPLQHQHWVVGFDFSPDGKMVATISFDFTARIWDLATGTPLTSAMLHPANLGMVRFSHNGQRLFTSCWDGNIRAWDVKATEKSLGELENTIHLLSAHRFDSQTGMMPLQNSELRELWEKHRSNH